MKLAIFTTFSVISKTFGAAGTNLLEATVKVG
jgi:hypothetical protein